MSEHHPTPTRPQSLLEADHSKWRRAQPHPALSRIAAIVLMAGSVRPSPIAQMIGRCVLDLPVDADGTILQQWQYQTEALAAMMRRDYLEVKVMVNGTLPMPAGVSAAGRVVVTIERDPMELRGTGGVLCDLARRFDDDDYLLVASAGQVLLDPLASIANEMAAIAGDVVVVSHRSGVPSGLMLLRCGCLRGLSPVGFVDMKEQALPRIARDHVVAVLHHPAASGMPVRSLTDYVEALRHYHRNLASNSAGATAPREEWRQTFSLAEPGSQVHADARLHDSVALCGAVVAADAVVVRSIVGPGAVVREQQMIVDQCVTAETPRGRHALRI